MKYFAAVVLICVVVATASGLDDQGSMPDPLKHRIVENAIQAHTASIDRNNREECSQLHKERPAEGRIY